MNVRRLAAMLLAASVVVCGFGSANGVLISVTNNNSNDAGDVYLLSLGDQNYGELVHIDRTHTFNNLPGYMQNLDYVLTANDDKTAGGGFSVDLTFDPGMRLYLSIDDRVDLGSKMAWVTTQGWADTGDGWEKIGDAGHPFSVYSLDPAGTSHNFYEQNDGGSRNMYSISAGLVPPMYALLDIGPSGQRVETVAGAAIAIGTAGNNSNGPEFGPTAFTSDTGDSFTVTIDDTNTDGNDQGRIDWRDRGDSSNGGQALVKLGEDFIKNNSGIIRLTLGELDPGLYFATSYHIDPNFDQSGQIEVWVDAGAGFVDTGAVGNSDVSIGGVNSLTTGGMNDSSAFFSFIANGINDVAIVFNGRPHSDDETPLDGLMLRYSTAAHLWINPGTDDWSTGGNWLAGTVPGTADVARIDNGGTAQIHAPVSDVAGFNLGSGAGTSGTLEILTGGSLTTLASDDSYVGNSGTGVLTIQSGATLTLNDRLILGGGPSGHGTLNTAGTLNNPGSYLVVGDYGTGVFNQTDGTVTVDDLRVGYHDGTGTYTMSGSASELRVNDDAYIGDNGTGIFTQSGGNVHIENDLQFGRNAGSHGTLNISGGTMDATDSLHVGRQGTGVVNQTGGLVLVDDDLFVGFQANAVGTYDMDDGELRVENGLFVGNEGNSTGTLTQDGGTVRVTEDELVIAGDAGTHGTYSISGASSQLDVANDDMHVGRGGTGVFTQNEGDVYVDRQLRLGFWSSGDGTYNMNGGTLEVDRDVLVGREGTGTFIQEGGDVSVADYLRLGDRPGGNGTYEMKGGTLDTGDDLEVGYPEDRGSSTPTTGVFIHTGGTVTIDGGDDLDMGQGEAGRGTYEISGDSSVLLDIGDDLTIGHRDDGVGIFKQNGGTVLVDDEFRVGFEDDSVGIFTVTGGSFSAGGQMRVGWEGGATGTATISGPATQVTIGGESAVGQDGTGTLFLEDGASLDFGGNRLYIGRNGSGDGTVNVSGAGTTLTTTNHLAVGDNGTGSFTMTDGTVQAQNLRIAYHSGSGDFTLGGGNLTINDDAYIGDNGAATFNQTGGVFTVGDDWQVGRNGSATGAYTMDGGQLLVEGEAAIGYNGTGTVTMSGGTLNTSKLFAGQNGTGTFTILGSAATIYVSDDYSQNGNSELNPQIDNGGVSLILVDDDVPGHTGSHTNTASLNGDIRMGVYGGVALTVGDSFTILTVEETRSGTMDNVNPSIWNVDYPGNDVVAELINGLGTFPAGYAGPTMISVDPPLNAGNLTIDGIDVGLPLWVFFDVVNGGGDLSPGDLDDLAEYVASAGQEVYVNGGILWPSHELLGWPAFADYDLLIEFDPLATPSYLTWDFAAYDPSLLVTGVAIGIPEPSTLALAAIGLIGLLAYGWRKRRTG